jgi:hypothetical protein
MAIPLLQIVVVLLVLALAFWIYQSYIQPHVPEPFRTIIIVILAIAGILWLLSLVGLVGPITLR